MAEGTKDTTADEVIDLEGIVRDIDLTPTNSLKVPPKTNEPLHPEALTEDRIEELLMEESPELAAEMATIREIGAAKNQDEIKTLEQEDASLGDALQGKSRMTIRERISFTLLKFLNLLKTAKNFAKVAASDVKGVVREVLHRSKTWLLANLANRRAELKVGIGWLKSRSIAQKISLLAVILAIAGFAVVANRTLHGTLLPKTQKLWVANFADHADGTFTYTESDPFEDFNDPLLHPEFVILIQKIVVNLTRTEETPASANPMAAFEVYLQTDTQEAAIEIKDRSVEIRDSLSRAVERMTNADLVGEEGKTKLKLLIRRDLNGILTKGKVRRVFFKTFVLNAAD